MEAHHPRCSWCSEGDDTTLEESTAHTPTNCAVHDRISTAGDCVLLEGDSTCSTGVQVESNTLGVYGLVVWCRLSEEVMEGANGESQPTQDTTMVHLSCSPGKYLFR